MIVILLVVLGLSIFGFMGVVGLTKPSEIGGSVKVGYANMTSSLMILGLMVAATTLVITLNLILM